MGHQFGGRHTFNNCGGSAGDSYSLAPEVGSGTTIMGYAGICGAQNIQAHSDEKQKSDFIQAIVLNGNSLLTIISDIMDFSMLESNQMKLRIESISVNKLINDLYQDFGKHASSKGLSLIVDAKVKDLDALIESDMYRIKQVFNNLIGNALKFTEKGYVEIGYRIKKDFIEFKVKDTGIGILPEHHHTIFDRFRQIDTTKTRKYGGNGLGLAISKNLVELLGGKIWVESEIDKYSEFFFTIPLKS
jgi:signal transduction histidine kinase